MNHETRRLEDTIEIRRVDGKTTIRGYAAVFNSFSEDLGGFRELIRPGAFTHAIASGQDVRALVNHDENLLLGRTTSGTLRLTEDKRGLRYEVDPPDTQAARDIIALLDRGDISGSSFAFTLRGDKGDNWRMEGEEYIREVLDVDLYDVGPVVYPAYPATVSEAAHRSLSELKAKKAGTPVPETPLAAAKRELDYANAGATNSIYKLRILCAKYPTKRARKQ